MSLNSNNYRTNGNGNKPPTPESSSPSYQSPALRPTSIPSNGNPSPLLEATSFAPSTAPSMNEWMKGAPGLGSSPGNLISLMGESPPTQPSSYEDHRGMPNGWASPRPYYNAQHASPSPPNPARRPLSFHMDNHFPPPSEAAYAPSAASIRRGSMHSQAAYARPGHNPPLPHQPQAHFYGAPEIDLEYGQQTGIKAGERGYSFGFDTISGLNGPGSRGKDTVVLTGYEGGLEVHSASRKGVEPLASLKGLRGGVYYAKVLPWTCTGQESDLGPLVAVVVHGPMLPQRGLDPNGEGDFQNTRHMSGASSPASPRLGQTDGMDGRSTTVDFYQTSVGVYSLKDSTCVAVLLEGPTIPLKTPITSPIFQAPPPTGAFRILADSGSVVVSSGQTGESWVYRQASIPHEPGLEFRCVAKLWTTIQQPLPDVSQDSERARIPVQRQAARAPIIALKGRWIAYCPAAPSSQVSLRASIPVSVQGKAPGLATLTPPQLPSVISDVDLPGADSIMNKFMRETTQELIQGAKWVGERGLQAFNNYWNRSATPVQQARSPPPGPPGWNAPYSARQETPQFPPTHGAMAPAVSKEPGLVSIIDVETSLNLASIHPITTFATSGCSFLSFSPNGLSLFTASSKGDVQIVWDLMRIQYTKSTPLQTSTVPSAPTGPRVRQIAQFSRMTVARIVDVSWMKPKGECIAMVTERGTVHLLDLPSSAFTWPPPRRRLPSTDPVNAPEGGGTAVSMAAGALTSALDVARPLITRPRRSSSNAQTAGSRIVEHANYGGKMIAAGISHSLGKTGSAINQLRHNGVNRISLPTSTIAPGPSCVILVTSRKDNSLFVLGDGLVRTFPQRSHRSLSATGRRQRAPRFSRYKDFKLPTLPDDYIAASVKRFIDPDEYLDLMDKDSDGINNTMVLNARPRHSHHFNVESSIPQAEIESSAPYQPFHTDKRVALHEYGSEQAEVPAANHLPSVSVLLADTHLDEQPTQSSKRKQKAEPVEEPPAGNTGAWAFGQPVEATRLDYGHLQYNEEEVFSMSAEDSRALPQSAMERSIAQHDDDQIVITTRRRRGGVRNGDPDDDGFFEDDCEVLDFADQRV